MANLLEGGHGFVAVDAVEVEEIGHEVALDFDKGRVKLGIVVGAVNVEEQDNLSFDSEGLSDFAQVVAFFFGHRGLLYLDALYFLDVLFFLLLRIQVLRGWKI